MASPLQQQSLRRKLIYTGLILVLFALTTFGWRGLEFRNTVPGTWTVTGQANDLGIRHRSQGEVELGGSAIRLTLTGSRGFAVCYLWYRAMEKQKKHEWHELELLVRSLTKLQPHFITPWLFQSWNLAYNVSVESDLIKDKYFYMTEGIKLLGDGERQNQNHPDLRFSMGFYNEHKIGMSDQTNTLRCLYQLSSIDPQEWDPNRLQTTDSSGRQVVDLEKFEQFCQRHPMLVRRLREVLHYETPQEVVEFFQANRNVPSRYDEASAAPDRSPGSSPLLKAASEQFPVLPPRFDNEELTPEDELPDAYDCFAVSRAWFLYALQPLPPAWPHPCLSLPPHLLDKTKYRMPRYMAHEIFRGYPARGQSYVAEQYQKEGWFGNEGWPIRGWFRDDKFASTGGEAIVGAGKPWSRDAWYKAHEMWQKHGRENGLYKTVEELKILADQAELYRRTYDLPLWDRGTPPVGERNTEVMRKSYEAHDELYWYDRVRQMTNFGHFYFKSQVEALDDTVAARREFFEADQLYRQGKRQQALDVYREAGKKWQRILLAHADFANDMNVQEDSFEVQMKYVNLMQEVHGRRVRPLLVVQDVLTQAASRPVGVVIVVPPMYFSRERYPVPFVGPFDGKNAAGEPLIPGDLRLRVRERMGIMDPLAQNPFAPQPAPAAPDPGSEGQRPMGKR